MSAHIRFVNAMEQLPDPSPAVQAYIDHYRANLPQLTRLEVDPDELNTITRNGVQLWGNLTPAERELIEAISKGV